MKELVFIDFFVVPTIRNTVLFVFLVLAQDLRQVVHFNYRTHLSLDSDCPESRPIQPEEMGKVIALPEVGGFHHHYERRKAA